MVALMQGRGTSLRSSQPRCEPQLCRYELCGQGQHVKHLGLSFFVHKAGRGGPSGGVMVTLEIRWAGAACLAQCVARGHPHDGNCFHEHNHNAWPPRISLGFSSYLSSTFYMTGAVQGTVATVVNKTDKSSGVYVIGGGERT